MSASKSSSSLPSDTSIERALRSAVATLFANDSLENLTVKRVRKSVEHELELPVDYLKTNSSWADKSKEIITNESELQEAATEAATSTPQKTLPRTQKVTLKSPAATKKVTKRRPDIKPKPRKRQKTESADNDNEKDEEGVHCAEQSDRSSDLAPLKKVKSQLPRARTGGKARAIPESGDDEDDNDHDIEKGDDTSMPVERKMEEETQVVGPNAEDSDSSEMSILIDEPPRRKPRQKKGASEKSARKEEKPKAKVAKVEKELNPDDAEIKRLQGWLLKCGIRRLWGKELAQFESSKAKIKHLRDMLKDVGMDGRYSLDKAKQIKEQRELAAELDAVKEGARRWGQEEESDQASDTGKPRRRLAKGLQEFQFLDSSGEDSD